MSRQLALPHSEESERAVLAGVMLDNSLLAVLAARLQVEDFYGERHQILYRVMLELQRDKTGIDQRTVQAKLEQQGLFEKAGGISYLANLDLDLPDLGRLEAYVEIVKETSIRRRLIESAGQIIRDSLDGGLSASDGLQVAESTIRSLAAEAITRPVATIGELVISSLSEIEDRPAGQTVLGLATGFADLDDRTSGLHRGNFIVLAGATGMGKSSLAMNIAQNVAIRQRKAVGVFSLEMSGAELSLRMLASEADVPFDRLRAGTLSHNQWGRVHSAARLLSAAPIYIDDGGGQTILAIQNKARRWRDEFEIELMITDYIQLVGGVGRFNSRDEAVGSVSRGHKLIAKELNIPVIGLSQFSRANKDRSNKRPLLSDLRESGSIENDADAVVGIYREEYYEPTNPDVRGLAEVIWLKLRNGETGTDEMVFIGQNTTFKSLSRQADPNAPARTARDAPF
ncbi:MAG TPA: replicative DNA helicase [Thermoanaerobaculia bacterium]|jgi:replicative DNA helicase|nr:replicative DNA helicase [Thermoanaerobaculia bacterium]